MSIPKEILVCLKNWLIENKHAEDIEQIQNIGGGSINEAVKISTSSDSYFLKYNDAAAHPQMFFAELKGLELLSKTSSIRIPKAHYYYEGQAYSFILLEWMEQNEKEEFFWEQFAVQLAQLHRASAPQFGLDFDNYMGSLHQSNKYHDSFIDFFINERLLPQLKIARDTNILDSTFVKKGERLFQELPSIFPIEKPALVHGDLWSGNFMNDEKGGPVIMDPAVYFGHREVDIAMTTMFGGFSSDFYGHYQSCFPMEVGWEKRLDYYNLYPVLVHINLFGASYLPYYLRTLAPF